MDEKVENITTPIRCEDELTLQRLLDEELDADASELVFHHLKGCRRCSAIFQELKELKALCEGQLGLEDEVEGPFSTATVNRVRTAIETATVAQPIQGAAESAIAGNGGRQKNRLIDRVVPKPTSSATVANLVQSFKTWVRSINAGFLLRPGMVTAIVTIIVVAVGLSWWLRTPTSVSAAELLRQSAAADDAVTSHGDQVLRRTINLEMRAGPDASLSDARTTALRRRIEIWQSNDKGLAARRFFDDENHLLAGEWKKADGSRTVYQEGTQPQVQPATERQPATLLKPTSIWLMNVSAKDFSALIGNSDAARVEQQGGTYVISYNSSATNDGLVKAKLTLSKGDLHTIEETLLVNSSSPNTQFIEYRFAETSFERRTPNTVAPAVFEPDPAVLAMMKGKVEGAKVKPEAESPAPVPGPQPLSPATASTELEVEVLEKLNRVNALQGEQLSLTRTPEGRLLVSGMVETSGRKSEILRSLADVAKNPAVRIDVTTVAEAQTRKKSSGHPNITNENVEVTQNTIPVDTEVRSYFSHKGFSGQQLENEIERLSRSVLGHSSHARSHALALKQIAERFSPADIEAMDTATRARWRALMKEHANSFSSELEEVRHELAPIFPGANSGGTAGIDIASDQEMARAARRLFDLVSLTDNGLRRSFSLSSERSDAPVRSQQFWQSFSSAQALATKIANRQ